MDSFFHLLPLNKKDFQRTTEYISNINPIPSMLQEWGGW
jgi:hypothetical protein